MKAVKAWWTCFLLCSTSHGLKFSTKVSVEIQQESIILQLLARRLKAIFTNCLSETRHIGVIAHSLNTLEIAQDMLHNVHYAENSSSSIIVFYVSEDNTTNESFLNDDSKDTVTPGSFVIFVEYASKEALEFIVYNMKEMSIWNPAAKFLVVETKHCLPSNRNIPHIFHKFFSYNAEVRCISDNCSSCRRAIGENTENLQQVSSQSFLQKQDFSEISYWNNSESSSILDESSKEIREMFGIFWKERSVNVAIIVAKPLSALLDTQIQMAERISCSLNSSTVSQSSNKQYSAREGATVETLSYDPFRYRSDIWSDSYLPEIIEITKVSDTYYEKAANLNGNDFRASMFTVMPSAVEDNETLSKFRGCDAQLVEALAHYMNANLVMVPNDGTGFGKWNGSTNTGADGDVIHGRSDIAPNTRYILVERLRVHSYTYPHDKEDLCVLVEKSSRIPQYLNIVLPFRLATWFATFASLPLTGACWLLLRPRHRDVAITLLETFSSFLNVSLPSLPRTWRERMLVGAWAMFSLVVTSSYQGSLTSYLTIPQFMPDINTMEQLEHSSLRILIHPELLPVFRMDSGNPVMEALSQRLVPDLDMEGYPAKIRGQPGTWCALVNAYVGQFLVRNRHQRRQLHLASECPLPAIVALATPLHSPLQSRLDGLLSRIVQAGLYKQWQRAVLQQAIAAGKLAPITSREGKPDPQRITPTHLQAAFFVLGFGYLLSTCVLVCENFRRHWSFHIL